MAQSIKTNEEIPSATVDDRDQTAIDADEEAKHFRKIINGFLYYKSFARNQIRRAFYAYGRLSTAHKRLVPKYEAHLAQLLHCIDRNDALIREILNGCEHLFMNSPASSDVTDTNRSSTEQDPASAPVGVTSMDMDKVKTTMKQFVRDWSEEGEQERLICYAPIIDEVKRRFPLTSIKTDQGSTNDFSPVQILVPRPTSKSRLLESLLENVTCEMSRKWVHWIKHRTYLKPVFIDQVKNIRSGMQHSRA